MPKGRIPRMPLTRRAALIWAAAGVVHQCWQLGIVHAQTRRGPKGSARSKTEPPAVIVGAGAEDLPPAVADMRAAIQAAVETGNIAELKGAMDLNELKPEFGGPVGMDPIAHLTSLSADGSGKDVLDLLGRLLDGSWAAIPGGRDIENNRIYVWPHFAEVPIGALKPEEQSALVALLGAEQAMACIEAKRYRGWRLSIGADGVWHMFTRVNG